MTFYRARMILVSIIIFMLLAYTPGYAKPAGQPYTFIDSVSQPESHVLGSALTLDTPGLNDIPDLLNRASIPERNLHSSNALHTSISPQSSGDYEWHTFYGADIEDEGNGIAIDSVGDIYIVGMSYAAWNGPDGQPPLHAHSSLPTIDLTVLKLDASGAYQWHTFYPGTGLGIAVDGSGGVYITGVSASSWDGPQDQPPLHTHGGGSNITVLKLDSSGVYQWHTFYGTNYDAGLGIVLDSSGGIYITGYSDPSWDGPQGQAPLHAFSGSWDITVLKLDTSGGYLWHTFYGSAGYDWCIGIAVDGNGGVLMAGRSLAAWGGPLGQAPLHAYSGNWDITVLKLDASGAYQWHTFYGAASDDYGKAITVDGNGEIYLAGMSNAPWDGPQGESPLHAHSMRGVDFVIIKLSASGTYLWHTFYGVNDYLSGGSGIAVDGIGGVYVIGTSGAAWVGPQGQAPLHAHRGNNDCTILKLDASGAYLWHTFYGSAENDSGSAIALDRSGSVYATGTSVGSWNGPQGESPLHAFTWGQYPEDITVLKLQGGLVFQYQTYIPLTMR